MKLYRYLNFKASEAENFNPYRRSKVEVFNDQNEGDSLIWSEDSTSFIDSVENLIGSTLENKVSDFIRREFDFEVKKPASQIKVTDLPVSIMCLTAHAPNSVDHNMWRNYGFSNDVGSFGECLEYDVKADELYIEFVELANINVGSMTQKLTSMVSFFEVEYGHLPFLNSYSEFLSFEKLSTLSPDIQSKILLIIRHMSFAKKRDPLWAPEREFRFVWSPLMYGVIGNKDKKDVKVINFTEDLDIYPRSTRVEFIGRHLKSDEPSVVALNI